MAKFSTAVCLDEEDREKLEIICKNTGDTISGYVRRFLKRRIRKDYENINNED